MEAGISIKNAVANKAIFHDIRVKIEILYLSTLLCDIKNAIINPLNLNIKELKMAEAKGLMKPVKLKNELAALLGAAELPRTEITKKLWDYIKANKLQTKTENGKAENAGKFIVADAKLLPIFKKTKSTSKSGKLTDLTQLNEGQTIDMMQMAAVVSANIE